MAKPTKATQRAGSKGTTAESKTHYGLAGPQLTSLQRALTGRRVLPFIKGRAQGSRGVYDQHGPPIQDTIGGPTRAQRNKYAKGRIASSPGHYCQAGPPVTPLQRAVTARRPVTFSKGRVRTSPPVFNGIGPPLYPLHHPLRAAFPTRVPVGDAANADANINPFARSMYERGPYYQLGPPLTPLQRAVRAQRNLYSKGWARADRGFTPIAGPPVKPLQQPVKTPRLTAFSRGRGRGLPGGFDVTYGPRIQDTVGGPTRAQLPPPRLHGRRVQGNAGAPLAQVGSKLTPLTQAKGRGKAPVLHGRVQGETGTYTWEFGSQFYPLRHPVKARPKFPVLFGRRIVANSGAPRPTFGPPIAPVGRPVIARRPRSVSGDAANADANINPFGRAMCELGTYSRQGPQVYPLYQPVRAQPKAPVLHGHSRGTVVGQPIATAVATVRPQNVIPRNVRQVHRALVGNNQSMGDGNVVPTTNNQIAYNDPNYITNLCTNPSFEVSLAGWAPTDKGTTFQQTDLIQLYGNQVLEVTTSGSIPNQGAVGPPSLFPYTIGFASMSVSVFGETGTLQVSFINGSEQGAVMATQAVILDGAGWQTVTFSKVPFSPGCNMYVLITTMGPPQSITFYVDGAMYTPDGTRATQYVDGDQANCFWSGTPELSTSYMPFEYAISGSVGIYLSGFCTVVVPGETFSIGSTIPVLEFYVDPLAGATAGVLSIAGAFTDFGIWNMTDPDPAQTYGWWTNAQSLSSHTGYTRIYGMVTPPLDYQVSGQAYAWRRAAYMAVGFEWASVPNNTEQILTDVQLEYARTNTTSAITPTTYTRPRQMQVIIKPNRLNYITNPAFQNGTSGWTQDGTTVGLGTTSYVWPSNISTYDDVEYSAFQSCLVTLNQTADQGVQISIPFLIPGETYMVSFYVQPNSNGLADILGSCGGGSADLASLILPQWAYGGEGIEGYGAGPYGGIASSSIPLPTNVGFTRVSFPFVAASDTEILYITATMVTPPPPFPGYPQSFYLTGVVCEPGDILLPYFDGNSGPDAMWEYSGGTTTPVAQGGTVPGTSRSYYYEQLQFGQGVVTQTLASNTPLGISAATPLYATPPTQ